MVKRLVNGLIGGCIGAFINVAFLFMAPGLEKSVFVATAITWIAIGMIISIVDIKLPGMVKGMLIALLVAASNIIYTIVSSPIGAVWTVINTLIWGAVVGFFIDKRIKKNQ